MATLTENAIQVTVRDRAKRTKIWDQKGYKSKITNIFKNSKFYKKKFKMADLNKSYYLGNSKRQNETEVRAPYFEKNSKFGIQS